MLTGHCVRLLCRSAAALGQQSESAAARLLIAAAAASGDCSAQPPASPAARPPPPPPLALLLCQSRHRPAVPRPASATPAAPATPAEAQESALATAVGPGLSHLTVCCRLPSGALLSSSVRSSTLRLAPSTVPRLAPGLAPSSAPPLAHRLATSSAPQLAPSSAPPLAPQPAHRLCAGRAASSDFYRTAVAWPSAQCRFYSEQSEHRRRSVMQDMRRTGHKVRATVGHMVSHENIYTVPNALCLTRIALTPVIAYLVTSEVYTTALACFIVAGVTDLLDGWIARTFPGQSSLLGSFLDPLADKLLVATLFLSLTYTGLIPLGLTLLTVARDLGLITAAAWVRYKSVPPPVTLARYFDPTFATARLEPTLISKFNTFLQLTLVASTLAAPVMGFVDHTALRVLWCVTAGTTVTSGMVYALLQSSTYQLMERGGDHKRSP